MFININYVTMFLTILLSLIFLTNCTVITQYNNNDVQNIIPNDRPIIGILTEEINYPLRQTYRKQYSSYIAASYVKFIEGAGGRVVPIWIGQNTTYYKNIIGKINGVLWPGGSTDFTNARGYAKAGYKIYQIAKEINEAGDYFPIFGICLGIELLAYIAANNVEPRVNCSSNKQALPLHFSKVYTKSRLFGNASPDIINILKTENVTINFHHYCLTEESLKNVNLSDEFLVTSLNKDTRGLQFISSLEHIRFPFYGLQFHPEKNLYEWVPKRNIPHTYNAVRISQYFANFFLNEGRKSTHRFGNPAEEVKSLIYNYPTIYTGINGSAYEQCYLFS